MSAVLILTTLVDALAVVALAWLVRRAERAQTLALAEQQAVLARLRGELSDLVSDAERRARALDHALAMREATLRVLLQATVATRGTAGEAPAPIRPRSVSFATWISRSSAGLQRRRPALEVGILTRPAAAREWPERRKTSAGRAFGAAPGFRQRAWGVRAARRGHGRCLSI